MSYSLRKGGDVSGELLSIPQNIYPLAVVITKKIAHNGHCEGPLIIRPFPKFIQVCIFHILQT